MIKISGCADTVFEEAYFVLKPGVDKPGMSERDIIAEANRIIRENCGFPEKDGKRFVKMSVSAFFVLLGMGIMGLAGAVVLVITFI